MRHLFAWFHRSINHQITLKVPLLLFSHQVMSPFEIPWTGPEICLASLSLYYLSECLLGLDKSKGLGPRRRKNRDDNKSSSFLVFSKSIINQNYNYSVSLLGSSHYGLSSCVCWHPPSQDKTQPTSQTDGIHVLYMWISVSLNSQGLWRFPKDSLSIGHCSCIESITIPAPDQFLGRGTSWTQNAQWNTSLQMILGKVAINSTSESEKEETEEASYLQCFSSFVYRGILQQVWLSVIFLSHFCTEA